MHLPNRLASLAAAPLLVALAPTAAAFVPDVTAELRGGGKLVVEGDDDPNGVSLRQVPGTTDVIVTPAPGQTLNGGPGPLTFGPVTGDVEVKMKRGTDRVSIERLNVGGDLKVDLGEDNGVLRLVDARVVGDLEIKSKDADDIVLSSGCLVGGDATLDLRGGTNQVLLELRALGKLEIRGGDGHDVLHVRGTSGAAGDVKVDLGDGLNEVLSSGTLRAHKLEFKGGDDTDVVRLEGCTEVAHDLKVELRRGDDAFVGEGLHVAGMTEIVMDRGADSVRLASSATCDAVFEGRVRIEMGDGMDLLCVTDCRFEGDLRADGGADGDALLVGGVNVFLSPPDVRNFERRN